MNTIAAKIVSLVGWGALCLISSVHAVEFNQIKAANSSMSFVFKQMNVPVEGVVQHFKSQISFDPAKPALAKVEIEIPVSSIDAGSDEANDAVVDKLWFNAKVFPFVRFSSTSIKTLGNNRFEVLGKMSIKGRTLAAKTLGTFHQQGKYGVFEGSIVLNRADYGIGEGLWADFGTVANEVQIKFRIVASATAVNKL
ncbi:MAG: YceI family protein [Gallionellaceae bacterium]